MFKKLRDLLLPIKKVAEKQCELNTGSKVTVIPNPNTQWLGDFEYTVSLTCSGELYTLNVVTDNLSTKQHVRCPGCGVDLILPGKFTVTMVRGQELPDINLPTNYDDGVHIATPNGYKRYILRTSPDQKTYPSTSKKCFPGKL